MKYPMLLEAPLKNYIWGGTRLKTEYGRTTDFEVIAESWELSCHEDGESVILNGAFSGKALSAVVEQKPDFAGENSKKFKKFPLLVKLIDANDKLSVQVHPNDEYAYKNENGEYGKTEVWYIVDAVPDAKLIYGLKKDVTKQEFSEAIKDEKLADILNFVPVKKDDVFFIPSGLIHAICEGILICEIQQNSNTTYRAYDWGRRDKNGNSRELHIEHVVNVSKLTAESSTVDFALKKEKIGNNIYGVISECEYFKAYKYDIFDKIELECDGKSFHTLTFISGQGNIEYNGDSFEFSKGKTYFIPADLGKYLINGKCEFILSGV